jgi:hypothetical protein
MIGTPGDRKLSRESYRFSFTRFVAISLLFALSSASCVQDLGEILKEKRTEGDSTISVVLSLAVPETRAGSADATAAENAIGEINVLLFDQNDANEKFIYRAAGTSIADNGASSAKKFEVRLPLGGPYKAVVLANAQSAVQGLPIATLVANGAPRVSLLNSLVHADALGVTHFPMWGYLDNLTVQESTNNIASIPLTRAVARLDFSAPLGGRHRMLPIHLRQEYYALVVEGVDANGYLADETIEHSFTVKSNRAWTASITNSAQAAHCVIW